MNKISSIFPSNQGSVTAPTQVTSEKEKSKKLKTLKLKAAQLTAAFRPFAKLSNSSGSKTPSARPKGLPHGATLPSTAASRTPLNFNVTKAPSKPAAGMLWDPSVALVAKLSPDEYGNKTANLSRLDSVLQTSSLGGKVAVPPFHGISHDQIRSHLMKAAGPALLELEKRLQKAAPKDTKTLSSEARDALRDMRQLIRNTFTQTPLPLTFPIFGKDARLMVRSTGREDSETMANAGGNKSIANVQDSQKDVNEAIAEVVSSYFSDRSILQRLLEGDDISAPPFTPVLVQIMVGERPGGGVPTSGVMFTTEPEGPTPVTQIQATFGHNEAVVASLLPCDTYLVGPDSIRLQKKHKTQRLVPNQNDQGPSLVLVDNPPHLRISPALSEGVVRRLDALGKLLSSQQDGTPLDIEFTYTPENDTVYLLQMRPLVLSEREKPTHLDPVKFRDAARLKGQMVGTAGGKTRLITSSDAVLTADSLTQALQIYLGHKTPKDIQFVAVEGRAEPTSHEATMFRAARKPVMIVDNLERLRDFLSAHPVAALDASMGELIDVSKAVTPGTSVTLESLKADGFIRDGWGKHPLSSAHTPVDVSMSPRAMMDLLAGLVGDIEGTPLNMASKPMDSDAFASLLDKLQVLTAQTFARAGGRKGEIQGLLHDLRTTSDAKTRSLALASLIRLSYSVSTFLQSDALLGARAKILFNGVCAQADALRNAARVDPQGIMYLHELNGLTSLLLHQDDTTIVGNDSFEGLLAEHKERSKLPVNDMRDYRQAYERLGKLATRSTVAKSWSEFVESISKINKGASNQELAQLVYDVQTLNVAEFWLHTAFVEAVGQSKDAGKTLKLLREEFSAKANTEALSWSTSVRRDANTWRGRVAEWADPSEFDALLTDFKNGFVSQLQSINVYESAGRLGKLAVLASLSDAVDVFDVTIKGLTGSSSYDSNSAKAANFLKILRPYSGLVITWIGAVPELANHRSGYKVEGHWVRYYDSELRYKNISSTQDEFQPSSSFNVAAAQIGSGTEGDQHMPKTLEDFFTLSHQNLLAIIGSMTAATLNGSKMLPIAIDKLADNLLNAKVARGSGFRLVGVNYQHPQLSVSLNATLREHSMKIEIAQNVSASETFDVKVYMFGLEEHNRQERSMLYATIFGTALGIPFAPEGQPVFKSAVRTTSWHWRVPSNGNATEKFSDKLTSLLGFIAHTTFDPEPVHKLVDNVRSLVPNVDQAVLDLPKSVFERIPMFIFDLLVAYPNELKFYELALGADAQQLKSNVGGANKESISPDNIQDNVASRLISAMQITKSPLRKKFEGLSPVQRQGLADRVWARDAVQLMGKAELFQAMGVPFVPPQEVRVSTPLMRQMIENLVGKPYSVSSGQVSAKVIERRLDDKSSGIYALALLQKDMIRFEITRDFEKPGVIRLNFRDRPRPDLKHSSSSEGVRFANSIYAKMFGESHGLRFVTGEESRLNRHQNEAKWSWEFPEGASQTKRFADDLRNFMDVILERDYSPKNTQQVVQRLQKAIPNFSEAVKKTPTFIPNIPWLYEPLLSIIPEHLPLYTAIASGTSERFQYELSVRIDIERSQLVQAREVAAVQLLDRIKAPNSDLRTQALSLTPGERGRLVTLITNAAGNSATSAEVKQLLGLEDQYNVYA